MMGSLEETSLVSLLVIHVLHGGLQRDGRKLDAWIAQLQCPRLRVIQSWSRPCLFLVIMLTIKLYAIMP